MPPAYRNLSRRPLLLLCFASLLVESTVPLAAQVGSISNASPAASSSVTPITVAGQVINALTGEPIPRVLVRINERALLTSHEGKFEFDQFTGGSNGILQITKPGYYLSADPSEQPVLNLTADQLAEPIEVRLYPEALLTGTVTAPDGEPIQHVPVTARHSLFDGFADRWVQGAQSQTDSHGNFRLPIPPGDYKLETRYVARNGQSLEAILPLILPEHTSSNSSDVIHVSSGEHLHFDLHPQISRAYDVVAHIDGMPERTYPSILAQSSNGSIFPVGLNRNGPSDEYRMQLPTGTYTLTATVNGPDSAAYAQAIVTVPDHDISGVVLHLTPNPGIPVELQVDQSLSTTSSTTSDNVTPPNLQQLGLALISTESDTDRGTIVGVTPRPNQTFNFVASPGTYHLQARNHGQWYVNAVNYGTSDLLQQELVVGPGSSGTPIRVTVSNQTSALQGTLRLNGKPAACWLYLIPTGPSADPLIFLRSSASGSYNSPYLPPGGYQAIAFEHRYPADLRNPETLARFSTYVHSITANAGDKPTLDLDAVPAAEMLP